MAQTLDDALHGPSALPIVVKPDGTFEVTAYPPDTLSGYAPESVDVDWSGEWDMPDVLEEHERAALDGIEGGWEALTGWSGHSLFIFESGRQHFGPDLEARILEEPGLWTIVSVEMQPPTCDAGDDGMPCQEWNERERCDHADYPAESKAAGWALLRRDRPVKLGEDMSERENSGFWPVLRNGEETGTYIVETRRGYHFRAPRAISGGDGYKGASHPIRDDARKDAEEWLTQNVG